MAIVRRAPAGLEDVEADRFDVLNARRAPPCESSSDCGAPRFASLRLLCVPCVPTGLARLPGRAPPHTAISGRASGVRPTSLPGKPQRLSALRSLAVSWGAGHCRLAAADGAVLARSPRGQRRPHRARRAAAGAAACAPAAARPMHAEAAAAAAKSAKVAVASVFLSFFCRPVLRFAVSQCCFRNADVILHAAVCT